MLASILLSDEQFFEELVFWDPLESQIANESLTADNYVVWLHAKVRTWGRQIVKAPFGPQPLVLLYHQSVDFYHYLLHFYRD
ncbi:hypothetical protein [Acetobacter okinawensis]|uniref:hypothetical protein n=1 Tax=Acetobacter okinawensis TaxID=1076594 RepID=UPI001FD0A113|nr:hypothetical protein [Acetobacter okinawensis]